MSLNQILTNTTNRLDIVCDKLDCNEITGGDTLIDELSFKAQNGDIINLSTLPDKGIGGYRLTSDGDGSVSWAEGAGSSGVDYNGVAPVAIGQLAIYGATNGKLIKDSSLSETDITDLQTDKLDKTGGTISSDLTVSGTLKIGQVSDNSGGLSGITFNNISRFNAGMRTTNLGNPSIGDVQLISDIDGNSRQLKNNNAVYTDNLYSKAGLGLIKVNNGGIDFQSTNSLFNVNNTQTQSISATDGVSINFQDDVNMGLYDLNNVNDIRVNALTSNTVPNIVSNNTIDMNNNNIIDCNEIKTDFIASSTNSDVKMNSDLNLNGKNIIGLDLINGIQPSGGLYSESSGFSTASLTEIDILGQGASSGSLSIPADTFTALSMYSFKASGVLSGGTNDLFTLRANTLTSVPSTILLGEIMVTLQDNGLVNVPWDIMIDFTIRATGIAGTASLVLSGAFRYNNNNDVVRTFLRTIVLTTGFDTTIDNTLQLTFQNDGTNPLTSFRIDQASFTKWY